jgi:preprotein translocase subunit YajC
MNLLPFTIAQAAPAECSTGGGSSFSPLVIMAIIFAIFYFMMIRPQRRRDKERKAMIANVKKGDRVLLTSGILGEIATIKDQSLIVRIAENTKIEVVKAAISQVLEKGETPTEIEPTK